MSDHSSLINRICFEQVKPKTRTPKKIEPTEAIELLNKEKVIVKTGEESEKLNLDQKILFKWVQINEWKISIYSRQPNHTERSSPRLTKTAEKE